MFQKSNTYKSIDKLIILVLLFVHLTPLYTNDYFLTQDSPSHLYNGYVLKSILSSDNYLLSEYFTFQFSFSPNLVSTLLYTVFSFIFSQQITYVLIHIIIWVLLPFSVYYLLIFNRKENGFLTVFVFPFLYSFPFILGFDSFCLGLSLALLLYGFWLRNRALTQTKVALLISFLAMLLFFTHLVAACFFLIIVGVNIFISVAKSIYYKEKKLNQAIKQFLIEWVVFLPLISFPLIYMLGLDSASYEISVLTSDFNFEKLIKMDDLILFWSAEEGKFLKYLAITLLLVCGFSILLSFAQHTNKQINRATINWFTVILFLFLYFVVPDAMAGGSFISNRLILIFFITLIIASGNVQFPKVLKYSIFTVGVYLSLELYQHKSPYFERFDSEIGKFMTVLDHVEESSTLLYLNYHPSGVDESGQAISYGKGLFHHALGFISYHKKDIVLLKNYETYHSYFPVKWKEAMSPNQFLSCVPFAMSNNPPCVDFNKFNKKDRGVDYVFVYKHPDKELNDENSKKIWEYIYLEYKLIAQEKSGIIKLYKKI